MGAVAVRAVAAAMLPTLAGAMGCVDDGPPPQETPADLGRDPGGTDGAGALDVDAATLPDLGEPDSLPPLDVPDIQEPGDIPAADAPSDILVEPDLPAVSDIPDAPAAPDVIALSDVPDVPPP